MRRLDLSQFSTEEIEYTEEALHWLAVQKPNLREHTALISLWLAFWEEMESRVEDQR